VGCTNLILFFFFLNLLSLPSASAASPSALGAGAPAEEKVLCDAACEAALKDAPLVELPSGLSYKDITPGTGPTPPTGYQVVAHYVAMTPAGRVFDSSLTRGAPYDIRVGSGQIVAGLDEGIATMRVGGVRRVFVPGALAFPKGLPSGPGRPRVPPASPVVFDVQLLYIPGLDDE
jgi:peptidylprolyl isomerase